MKQILHKADAMAPNIRYNIRRKVYTADAMMASVVDLQNVSYEWQQRPPPPPLSLDTLNCNLPTAHYHSHGRQYLHTFPLSSRICNIPRFQLTVVLFSYSKSICFGDWKNKVRRWSPDCDSLNRPRISTLCTVPGFQLFINRRWIPTLWIVPGFRLCINRDWIPSVLLVLQLLQCLLWTFEPQCSLSDLSWNLPTYLLAYPRFIWFSISRLLQKLIQENIV